MLISVLCPECGSRYQLDPTMLGKKMRCPNALCRTIFEVREEAPEPTSAVVESVDPGDEAAPADRKRPLEEETQHSGHVVGSVGDLIPMLSAETVEAEEPIPEPPPTRPASAQVEQIVQFLPAETIEQEEPDEPPEVAEVAWNSGAAPPVRGAGGTNEPPKVVEPRPKRTKPKTETLREVPAGAWDAPPVRTGMNGTQSEPSPNLTAKRRSLSGVLTAAIAAGVVLMVSFAGWFVWRQYQQTEGVRSAEAYEHYKNKRFGPAVGAFRDLEDTFPSSPRLPRYHFLAELSVARGLIETTDPKPFDAQARLLALADELEKDPSLKTEYQGDLDAAAVKLGDDLAATGEQPLNETSIARADTAVAELRKRYPVLSQDHVNAKFAELRRKLDTRDRKAHLLGTLARLLKAPRSAELEEADRLVTQARHIDPGLSTDADVVGLLKQLDTVYLGQVRYEAAPETAPPPLPLPLPTEDPSIRIVPTLHKPTGSKNGSTSRSVFALAHGVLYALDPGTGAVRWNDRVGIDSEQLPVQLSSQDDTVLVLSSDPSTLSACKALDGTLLWRQPLRSAGTAAPAVVGSRIYLPTTAGTVDEFDAGTGKLLGGYDLAGQTLTTRVGAMPGTSQLVVAAHSRFVYLLDTDPTNRATKACVAVLPSNHPAGSLRGAPVLVHGEPVEGAPTDQLVLTQAVKTTTGEATAVRVFGVPTAGSEPVAPRLERSVRGWSWFTPYHDADQLAFVTDAGVLGLFGIRQPGTRDESLYLETPEGGSTIDLNPTPGTGPDRGAVVHAVDPDEWWVHAHGTLRRLHFDRYRQRFLQHWQLAGLGPLLHEAQVDEAGTTISLVTQPGDGRHTLVTAVDANSGKIRWQRQLGVLCHGEPLAVGDDLYLLGSGGGLYRFSPSQDTGSSPWADAGHALVKRPDALSTPPSAPLLFRGPGTSVFAVSWHAEKSHYRLTVRRAEAGADKADKEIDLPPLPAAIAGTPALLNGALLIPLADGTIRRQPFDGSAPSGGPDWLTRGADVEARGHVVALPDDEFLTTDGTNGLTRWRWPSGEAVWHEQARDKTGTARIVSAPVVVTDAAGKTLVAVADAGGTLALFDLDLKPVRSWPDLGAITAGPFLREIGGLQQLGCIVGRTTLVWFDPTAAAPLWTYSSPGDGIVGQPQLIGATLVIADLAGTYQGVDPATGQARGQGYRLQANVVPTATPLPYGPERAFAPLSDGTVLLLARKHFEDDAKETK